MGIVYVSGKMDRTTSGQETGEKGHRVQRSQMANHVVLGK